jgi:TldD protein
MNFHSEDKYFASSEGSSIQQYVLQTFASISANAVDLQQGLSRSRNYTPAPLCEGWEFFRHADLAENARRIREEVVEHLSAPGVSAGRKDLVLLPSHLALTIHESIGHPTELDRALGYEANYAGTSFLTPDKLGKERIGSSLVTFYGDRTLEKALATTAYDDDGVKTTRFPIIEKGIFRHFQTTRDQAHLVGEKESRGCCYAQSWSDFPFQRMPNVWLAAGPDDVTLDDLLSGVDDGILIDGRGSYSIDQQRYNFQFGGDAFWEIKGGKKRGMLSRVSYQAKTTDFWQACDGIAGRSYWQPYGFGSDAKGEPVQLNSMSHGCAPARFRQIHVLETD